MGTKLIPAMYDHHQAQQELICEITVLIGQSDIATVSHKLTDWYTANIGNVAYSKFLIAVKSQCQQGNVPDWLI